MAESTTLARPYARAAFDYAQQHNDLAGWSDAMNSLAAVVQQPKVAGYLQLPDVAAADQARTLIDFIGESPVQGLDNFIHVLAENKRLALLPDIAAVFEQLRIEQEKTVDVDITSAFELDEAMQTRLREALSTSLARKVNLQTEVDKRLIGGVVIRAGDTVIDGSVRGKLTKLAETMNS